MRSKFPVDYNIVPRIRRILGNYRYLNFSQLKCLFHTFWDHSHPAQTEAKANISLMFEIISLIYFALAFAPARSDRTLNISGSVMGALQNTGRKIVPLP